MKEDINIAEILKDMPKGTKLYSPVWGECELGSLSNEEAYPIEVEYTDDDYDCYEQLTDTGHFSHRPGAMCVLFPSKHMTDWTKLTWKKGDVLISKDGRNEVIFDHFNSGNEYYTFVGRHLLHTEEDDCKYVEDKSTYMTLGYSIEDKDAAQCYINTLEERFGGKLNPDTLDVEKQEEHIFKPFERVLTRDSSTTEWRCSLFSHMAGNRYACVDFTWNQCIPFEGNESLVGTTNSPRNLY